MEKIVLLVEDNPDDAFLTLDALRQAGVRHRVVEAHDGAQALDYLFSGRQAPPALVLLDLKLPKVDGLEVLRRLRADPLHRETIVIVLSSSSEDRELEEAKRLGANLYLSKAACHSEFLAIARRVGDMLPPDSI